MDSSTYFSFSSRMLSSTFQAHPILGRLNSQIQPFFINQMLVKGDFSQLKLPISFKQKYGYKLLDVIDTGWPFAYLISENFRNVLEMENITGWKTYPIIFKNEDNEEIKGFHGFSITGKSGTIDYKKSAIIKKRLAPNAPVTKFLKGIYIDMEKWDGGDFFVPDGTISIYCTQKVVEIVKKKKITNVEIENFLEIETIESAIRK